MDRGRKACTQLEADLERLRVSEKNDGETLQSEESIKAAQQRQSAEIGAIITAAEQRWKETAPVEQAKIKELQKRYYGLLNALRKIRREISQENAKRKQDAIAKAEALAASEDRGEAMRAAKELQRQWKEIGPTTHKDGRGHTLLVVAHDEKTCLDDARCSLGWCSHRSHDVSHDGTCAT